MSAHPPSHGISQEQFAALTQAMVEAIGRLPGGARVSVTDPRLTKAILWLLVAVGATSLTVGTWLVTEAIARGRIDERLTTLVEQHERRIDRLEDRKP